MKAYFESKNGLQKQDTTESVMHRIADRYMRENPAHPFMYRSFSEDGFKRDAEARCILDFNAKFPDAKMGEYAYAVSKMVCREKGYCIDRDGNIYGVCRGSGYSYREEYYKYELPWILNDTHGTGIVLMALVETAELQ